MHSWASGQHRGYQTFTLFWPDIDASHEKTSHLPAASRIQAGKSRCDVEHNQRVGSGQPLTRDEDEYDRQIGYTIEVSNAAKMPENNQPKVEPKTKEASSCDISIREPGALVFCNGVLEPGAPGKGVRQKPAEIRRKAKS